MGKTAGILAFASLLLTGTALNSLAAGNDVSPCAPAATLPAEIRTTNCRLADAVSHGMAASATFRRLVERIGELHGIVYLIPRPFVEPSTKRVFEGSVRHFVTEAGSVRMLYASILPGSGARPVIAIAHELQHAIEILESGATTEQAIDRLFERIGTRTTAWSVETEAAVSVQQAVARELLSPGPGPRRKSLGPAGDDRGDGWAFSCPCVSRIGAARSGSYARASGAPR